jgi:ABC-2 type transport system ATP-binding protein
VIHEPELLFLDEPTSAVDPENRRAFWESLFDLVDAGATILVSTHYMDEAERCHALAILDRGRLAAEGSPAELADSIDAQVVLVETDAPRRVGRRLHREPWVLSVAQVGNRLRVLVHRERRHAADGVADVVRADGHALEACRIVRPSLEDVFVAATLPHAGNRDRERAA